MDADELPEEVLSIKWGSSLEHQQGFLSEEYLQQNSAAYKILNDDFTREWSSDSGDERSWKKAEPPPKEEPKIDIKSQVFKIYKVFTAYPRLSNLTINQHEAYLRLMKKFSKTVSSHMSQQDQEEYQRYQNLHIKVAAEQMEYLEFLRNFALENQSRYSSISGDIKRYANERWKVKLKNPLKYPRYYRPYRTIGLVSNTAKDPLDFIPLDIIHKKGKVHIFTANKTRGRIERVYSKIMSRYPILTEEIANETYLTTFNCPVSKDQNAEVFAEKMNVDFVLSSSSLKKICDNFLPFNKFWEIPVIVKECNVEENGISVKKKVVFIDKALPPRKMTVVEKLLSYHKIAVKRYWLNYRSRDFFRREYGEGSRLQTKQLEEDPIDIDWNDTNNLECFGVDGSTSSRGKVKLEKHSENTQSSEQSAVLNQPPDETCAPLDNCVQGVQNDDYVMENADDVVENDSEVMKYNSGRMKNKNDIDVNSVCMSDSDDENLVIDDPEINREAKNEPGSQNSQALSFKDSGKMSPKSSEIDALNQLTTEEPPKRQTRNMAKMLHTISKVEEIASAKINKSKVHQVENSESFTIDKTSSNKDVNGNQNVSVETSGVKTSKRAQSLLDELLSQQEKWLEQEQRPKPEFCPRIPADIKERKKSLKDYKPIPPPRGCNHAYRLFTLKRKEDIFSPGYRLLIRYKIDAQEPLPRQRVVTIVPKLEFQPEFGAEIVSVSEMIQDWLSLRIRPFSILIRGRVDAFSSDIMMMEQKEIKDLSREEKYHNVQASSCLHTLDTVLRAFRDLPPGQYMCTHEPKMGAFASIYMATDDTRGGVYDLHAQYDVDTTADEPQVLTNLWVPIDFSIITPLQEKLQRIPGTFIPKSNKTKKSKPKKSSTGNGDAGTSTATSA